MIGSASKLSPSKKAKPGWRGQRPATPTRLNKLGIHLHRQFTYSTCRRQAESKILSSIIPKNSKPALEARLWITSGLPTTRPVSESILTDEPRDRAF